MKAPRRFWYLLILGLAAVAAVGAAVFLLYPHRIGLWELVIRDVEYTLLAVDQDTGEPISGATIKVRYNNEPKPDIEWVTGTTDASGTFPVYEKGGTVEYVHSWRTTLLGEHYDHRQRVSPCVFPFSEVEATNRGHFLSHGNSWEFRWEYREFDLERRCECFTIRIPLKGFRRK